MHIGANNSNIAGAPFRVYDDGYFVATNANITGSITATSGTFTGTITGSSIIGGTITGGTIKGGYISGGTISGASIEGGHISGSTISGGTLSGSTIILDGHEFNRTVTFSKPESSLESFFLPKNIKYNALSKEITYDTTTFYAYNRYDVHTYTLIGKGY